MRFPRFITITALALATCRATPVDESIARGKEALAARLWEVAAHHFREAFAVKNLAPETNARIALLLAEAWIREGKFSDALSLLTQSFVAKEPATPYWRALALNGMGQSANAIVLLESYVENPALPYHTEGIFTLAEIHQNHSRPEKSLAYLDRLINSSGPFASTAALWKAELLVDLGKPAEAKSALPDPAALAPADRPLAAFLAARVLLSTGQPQEAAAAFLPLVERPTGQSIRNHHLATTGLAEALAALGKKDEAVSLLLKLLADHPETPALPEVFRQLLLLVPAEPEPNDPLLEKLADFIPPFSLPPASLIASGNSEILGAGPVTSPPSSAIVPYALYVRASGLSRIPSRTADSKILFDRLRLEFPNHFLADHALYQLASSYLAVGETDRAASLLESFRSKTGEDTIKTEAAFLEARSAFENGDAQRASRLYSAAAAQSTGTARDAAAFNAALVLIHTGIAPPTEVLLSPNSAAELSLERALATTEPAEKKTALEAFLTTHPDHPRTNEARIAAANAALVISPPDLAFAKAQLSTLTRNSLEGDLLRLRIADAENDSNTVIPAARTLIASHPESPAAADAAYILARHLFLTRSYNDARLIIEKQAAVEKDPARAQAAWLLAARSAALVPTVQSHQEALILFDKAIALDAPLAALARIEKARLLIDDNRLAEAAALLRPWLAKTPPTDPLYVPTGILLAEALYASGSENHSQLTEALAVYDELLAKTKPDPAHFIRIQYLRGRVLEQLPDPKNLPAKREREAFLAYYSVLETDQAPAEWHYFELCGFRALALLEKEQRWQAAIACARRIASFKGPRAEEAAARAGQIQLKHMIWED